MYLCNKNTAAINLNVFLLPNGATTANLNYQIYANVQLASDDTYGVDMEKLVFANGEQIQASATTANVVTATVSYVGI
jgi:hypothetical protein